MRHGWKKYLRSPFGPRILSGTKQISARTGRVPGAKCLTELDERDPAVVAVNKRQIEDESA